MVKSRRAASARQSSVNATTACRPSVATSRRSVVTSKPRPSDHRGDRAMVQPRRHGADARRLQRRGHLLGVRGVARSISRDLAPRQRVAHRAADHARLGQRRHHRGQRRLRQEGRRSRSAAAGSIAHRGAAWPATIWPSSSRGRLIGWRPAAAHRPGSARPAPPASTTSTQAAPTTTRTGGPPPAPETPDGEQRRTARGTAPAQPAAACGPAAAQLLRQMHQDRGRRAPDVVIGMRPHPVLPPDAAHVVALPLRRLGIEQHLDRQLEHRLHLIAAPAADSSPGGSRPSTGVIR